MSRFLLDNETVIDRQTGLMDQRGHLNRNLRFEQNIIDFCYKLEKENFVKCPGAKRMEPEGIGRPFAGNPHTYLLGSIKQKQQDP